MVLFNDFVCLFMYLASLLMLDVGQSVKGKAERGLGSSVGVRYLTLAYLLINISYL